MKQILTAVFVTTLFAATTQAGWFDNLLKPATGSNETAGATSISNLGEAEIADGLKAALAKGVTQAVAELGANDGFLTNLTVKIPMPEKLQTIEKGLRAAGQNQLADEFVATMNHAAEQAVPVAASVFGDAIKQMTVQDAQAILQGAPDAATQYFKKTSTATLTEKFRPIVAAATDKVGLTAQYKQLMSAAGPLAGFLGQDNTDLDGYVTKKALDGLFTMVAAEEKQIRENPAARTSDLLQKVFGSK